LVCGNQKELKKMEDKKIQSLYTVETKISDLINALHTCCRNRQAVLSTDDLLRIVNDLNRLYHSQNKERGFQFPFLKILRNKLINRKIRIRIKGLNERLNRQYKADSEKNSQFSKLRDENENYAEWLRFFQNNSEQAPLSDKERWNAEQSLKMTIHIGKVINAILDTSRDLEEQIQRCLLRTPTVSDSINEDYITTLVCLSDIQKKNSAEWTLIIDKLEMIYNLEQIRLVGYINDR
jgi:hypothetical protein